MNDEPPVQAKDVGRGDSEEMAPARGVAFGVLLGAFIWFVATLAIAYWRFGT
jgi:hypothetical protein